MFCPHCGQETEKGKFCTNCGTGLPVEETAAAADGTVNAAEPANPVVENEQPQQEEAQVQSESNEFVERLKSESVNFGSYFVRMLKSPSEATKSKSNELIPGIITMVIFSLLIALGTYLVARSISSSSLGFGGFVEISFVDGFVLPLVQFLILFAVVAGLTFGGTKLTGYSLSLTDVLAKVGAYSIPFLLLSVAGALLGLLGLTVAGSLVILGLLGIILLIPTFIILEQPANGFDRIYALLGVYIIALFISALLLQSILDVFLNSLFGGFGF